MGQWDLGDAVSASPLVCALVSDFSTILQQLDLCGSVHAAPLVSLLIALSTERVSVPIVSRAGA